MMRKRVIIVGSGRDDYSSSTQKQSIDTIATSRNTSLKQYKLSKTFCENSVKSPPLIGMGSGVRFPDVNDSTNCHACLSTKVNSKINILSDCNINEIHLNIFPPSATYVKETKNSYTHSSQADEIPCSYLNIDVHEKKNLKTISRAESIDERRKMSPGEYSHISIKRCDSLLHISIGNSSKITKRHKRNSWLFANLWKFPRKTKSLNHKKGFFSPLSQLSKSGTYRLSDRSLNVVNEDLMISINKRKLGEHRTSDNFTAYNDGHQPQLIEREICGNFLKSNDDVEHGANELDCYMNEIKRREMS